LRIKGIGKKNGGLYHSLPMRPPEGGGRKERERGSPMPWREEVGVCVGLGGGGGGWSQSNGPRNKNKEESKRLPVLLWSVQKKCTKQKKKKANGRGHTKLHFSEGKKEKPDGWEGDQGEKMRGKECRSKSGKPQRAKGKRWTTLTWKWEKMVGETCLQKEVRKLSIIGGGP